MYLVISFLVLRAGCGIWFYQFLIIAYLFTLNGLLFENRKIAVCFNWHSLPGHYKVTDKALLAETM